MTNDSGFFTTRTFCESQGYQLTRSSLVKDSDIKLPLYEAKLIQQYDHRNGTFDGLLDKDIFKTKAATVTPSKFQKADPKFTIVPRYFVSEAAVRQKESITNARWFLVFRDIIQPMTNARCSIFAIVPRCGLSNKLPCLEGNLKASRFGMLLANANSFIFDFATRQKIGGASLNLYILKQLPTLPPHKYEHQINWLSDREVADWILLRAIELTYTAWDLEAFALDCSYNGPPFHWDEARRLLLRAELDAAYFHLYLGTQEEWGADSPELRQMFPTPRDAVEYIMETFPIVKRKDIARTAVKNEAGEVVTPGTYITKDTILEIYDEMATAIATGVPYQTRLDPPPGPPTDAAGNFIPMAQWDPNNWPFHIHQPRESVVFDTVPVTPVRTATPATRVPGIAASAAGMFPATDAQKLAVGLTADLAVRFSGSQEIAIRQYLGLATNPRAIGKLLAGEGKDTELANAVKELPDAFEQVNAEDAPWNKVLTTLQKNEAIAATDTDPVIVIAGPESNSVIEHFGTLPDGYMQLVLLAIKSLQSTVAEEMDRDVATFLEEAQSPWLTESTG